MKILSAFGQLAFILLAVLNFFTLPIFPSRGPLWDISDITYSGGQIWIKDWESIDKNTTQYGVTTNKNDDEPDFWLLNNEIQGELNFFFKWSDYSKVADVMRGDIIITGIVWVILVIISFFVGISELEIYENATAICGIISGIGLLGYLTANYLT
ncbi:MAG: hypothetical protein IPJ94_27895 [Chloroflexi bacterium]|nr:hypothetical protein [Chloroflexota bacterium]